VLNAIYEEDFLGFSYGFRPGREARVQNAIADADRRAAAFGGRINPTMYKACAGVAPPPQTA